MNSTNTSSSNLIKLDQYDLIAVNGEDALDFLHNQFTNDLKKLAKNTCSIAAWCSVKGRVLYSFRIWRTDEGFNLLLSADQTESFLKKLRMFIFRSKVSIEVLEEQFVYGLYGDNSEAALSIETSLDENQALIDSELTIIKLPARTSRYLLISSDNEQQTSLTVDQTSSASDWHCFDIEAEIIEIHPETSDLFLPQMLNLEKLGGLSFQKGCYPGQEIVARVKYRGELKKQLYRAEINSAETVSEGTAIVIGEGQQLSGHVVNCIKSDVSGHWVALVVINIKDADSAELRLKDQSTSSCSIQEITAL